jgi:hypothetical protein
LHQILKDIGLKLVDYQNQFPVSFGPYTVDADKTMVHKAILFPTESGRRAFLDDIYASGKGFDNMDREQEWEEGYVWFEPSTQIPRALKLVVFYDGGPEGDGFVYGDELKTIKEIMKRYF